MVCIHVRYHQEAEGWWAESEDLPGWTAVGSDFAELRDLVHSGVAKFAGSHARLVEEGAPAGPVQPESGPPGRPPRQTE